MVTSVSTGVVLMAVRSVLPFSISPSLSQKGRVVDMIVDGVNGISQDSFPTGLHYFARQYIYVYISRKRLISSGFSCSEAILNGMFT